MKLKKQFAVEMYLAYQNLRIVIKHPQLQHVLSKLRQVSKHLSLFLEYIIHFVQIPFSNALVMAKLQLGIYIPLLSNQAIKHQFHRSIILLALIQYQGNVCIQ